MTANQLQMQFTAGRQVAAIAEPPDAQTHFATAMPMTGGEKAKARDILAALRTLKAIEREQRPATASERLALARFSGFGAVALSLFPDPVTNRYKDESWRAFGHELQTLLSPDEYASARRSVFNAFYTSSTVIRAMYQGLKHIGLPDDALVLEPLCGRAHKGSCVA